MKNRNQNVLGRVTSRKATGWESSSGLFWNAGAPEKASLINKHGLADGGSGGWGPGGGFGTLPRSQSLTAGLSAMENFPSYVVALLSLGRDESRAILMSSLHRGTKEM